jgi:TPR repeat protein
MNQSFSLSRLTQFYLQGVPKNETKAFYYFLAAAEMGNDGDSLFNAGHCLQHGTNLYWL